MPFMASLAIRFSDEQWSRLVKVSSLPPEARVDFQGCVGFYRFARDREAAYRRAIGTSHDRKRWRSKALDLLQDLEATALAHPHVVSAEPWIAGLKDFAEELMPGRRKLSTGPQTQAARKLVELAAFFFEKHTNQPVDRSYKSGGFGIFINELCAIADPKITSGTIDEALKKLVKKRRGEIDR
jgi:hypothetical protein